MKGKINEVTIQTLKSILRNFKVGDCMTESVFAWGPPGIGKTDMFRQIANEWDADHLTFLTSTMDPTDIVGVPFPEGNRTRFLPPERFMQMTEQVDNPDKPMIAVFDDLPASNEQVFNALLGMFHGRLLGGRYPIRDNVLLCATGNRVEDKAGASELGTALRNRFIHFTMRLENLEWEEWAYDNDIDETVIAFIKVKPEYLNQFSDAVNTDSQAFATPRSVARTSKIVKALGYKHPQLRVAISGNCGEGWSQAFMSFIRNHDKIIDPETILKDPKNAPVPNKKDIDITYSTATSLVFAVKQNPTYKRCAAAYTYSLRQEHPEIGMILAGDLTKNVVAKAEDDDLRAKIATTKEFKEIHAKFGKYLRDQ